MLIVRPVAQRDLEDVLELACLAGKGMTSLPTSPQSLAAKIAASEQSFAADTPRIDDFFFLVLEDLEANRVIGTASIHARTGHRQAFYAYRVMPVTHFSHSLGKQVRSELLHLTNDYTDCSEVGSLFVHPEYRGNGRWLASARYLLMGQFPERFASHVIAELRGVINADGVSPVWEAIGRHFFEMEYEEADALCGVGSNLFITELMPKYPIYTCLLPEAARQAIGTPNDDSRRAMQFLCDEGYDYENVVDIFDGGPIMRGKISELRSVREQCRGRLTSGSPSQGGEALIATTHLKDFRVARGTLEKDGDACLCEPSVSQALALDVGQTLCALEVSS